jgi:hypothetical protein
MGLIVKRFPEKGIKIRLNWVSETVPVLNGHKVPVPYVNPRATADRESCRRKKYHDPAYALVG